MGRSRCELIEVGTQICEGLAAAHAAGVIHRDLKPGNIMLTRDGRVKILDFGLARQVRAPGVASTTMEISHTGVILGTPGYMSPEQVRGESADHRSDLFSLGVVLYEMASGKPAFRGGSSVEVMNSTLKDEPPELPPASPPALDRIVRRCVEKQPARRFQSAADLGLALGSLSVAPTAAVSPKTGRRRKWAMIGVAAAAATSAAFLWLARPLPPPRIIGMVQITNDGRGNGAPMLTDGARLLFNLTARDPLQVSVKGGDPAPLALPMRDDQLEDISRDGSEFLVSRMIGYDWKLERRALWAVPVFAGSSRRLGNLIATQTTFLSTGGGAGLIRMGPTDREQSAIAWSPDDQQLVYPQSSELHLARSDGTEVGKLATFEGLPFFARWSPDGRSLRVSVSSASDTAASLWEVSVNDGRARPLLPGWNPSWYTCCGNWTRDGKYYVFQSKSNIWALRERTGFFERANREPVQLTTGPMAYYWPLPSVDGKRIFMAGFQPRNEFRRYDLQSRRFETVLAGVSGDFPEFSRDGKWVTYISVPGGSLFRAASDGSQRLQLTWPPLVASLPHWSPNGKQIAFSTTTVLDRPGRVYVVAADGTGLRQVTNGEGGTRGDIDPSWSPDGASLVFGTFPVDPGGFTDTPGRDLLHVVDLKTNNISVLPGSEGIWSPRWSPDGRFIAGLSESRSRLMLYDLRTRDQTQLYGQNSGGPVWSFDGETLFFNKLSDHAAWRMRMADRKTERIRDPTDLADGATRGWAWFGVAPNNSFIIAASAVTGEIYALDWEAP